MPPEARAVVELRRLLRDKMEQGGTEKQRQNGLTGQIIAASNEVHRQLGSGSAAW